MLNDNGNYRDERPTFADTQATQMLINRLSQIPAQMAEPSSPPPGGWHQVNQQPIDALNAQGVSPPGFQFRTPEENDQRYIDFIASEPKQLSGGPPEPASPKNKDSVSRTPTDYERAGIKRFGAGYADNVQRAKQEQLQRRLRMDMKANRGSGRVGLVGALDSFAKGREANAADDAIRRAWMNDPAIMNPPRTAQLPSASSIVDPVAAMLQSLWGGIGMGAPQTPATASRPMSPGAPMEPELTPQQLNVLMQQLSTIGR